MAATTQSKHPWRATARTVVAAVIGFCLIAPAVVSVIGIPAYPAIAVALAVTGGVTRLLASPVVEAYLQAFVPWLAAAARDGRSWDDRLAGANDVEDNED